MEFFTSVILVTVAVFIMMAGIGIRWATDVSAKDVDIRETRARNRKVEKLAREKLRHDQEMSRIRRRNRRNRRTRR
jgi:uncharacterized membrane protein YqjE